MAKCYEKKIECLLGIDGDNMKMSDLFELTDKAIPLFHLENS